MGTLIKVADANWASNNIGNYADYSDFTVRTIAYKDSADNGLPSTSKLSFTELSALNTLDVAIEALGLWSKIKSFHPFKGNVAQQLKLNFKDVTVNDIPAAERNASSLIDPRGWVMDDLQQTYAMYRDLGCILNQNTASDFTGTTGTNQLVKAGNEFLLWQWFNSAEMGRFVADSQLYTNTGVLLNDSRYVSTQANGLVGMFTKSTEMKFFFKDGTTKLANHHANVAGSGDYPNSISLGNANVRQTISMIMFTDALSDLEYSNLNTAIKVYLTAVGELIA